MPDGVMKWFDAKNGEGEITRGGRRFRARSTNVEPVARHAGARVHFDVRRVEGAAEAIDVRLRPGTRVSHRQHRFGTLVGARSGDTKGPTPYAGTHPGLRAGTSRPLEVVRAWASSVMEGDVTGALSLYSPNAIVHVPDRTLVGRATVHAWLADNPTLGSRRHARIRGEGGNGTFVVWWGRSASRGTLPQQPGMVVRCRVSHAQIAEQWVSPPEPPETLVPTPASGMEQFPLELATRGDVREKTKASARAKVLELAELLREPVLFARVKLTHVSDPSRQRPATAEAVLDLDGALVRAHVAAPTMPEAVDLMMARLRDQLEHRGRRLEYRQRRGATHEQGEWRHGDVPTERPPYFDRPGEEREILRQKTFAVDEITADEAVFDMEQLDYDFYLFRDLADGADCLIERVDDGTYRLTRVSPPPDETVHAEPVAAPIAVSETPAPALGLDDAVERLNTGDEPRVFFADPGSGHGQVLYRRYDGHYGLVTSD